jgi:hypothetical protein
MTATLSASFNRLAEDVLVQPVVVAELELGDVQREILLADLVERADDAALDEGPEAFDRVRVDRADDVLALGMVDRRMLDAVRQVVVGASVIVREEAYLVRDGFADEVSKRLAVRAGDHASNYVPLALDCADHDRLALAARPVMPIAAVAVLVLAADVGFVNLDDAHQLAKFLVREPGADAMAHEPSGSVGAEAHHAVDLEGANPFLAGEHQENDAEPLAQRLIRVLEDRAGDVREAVIGPRWGAHVAEPIPRHRAMAFDLDIAATRASDASRPAVPDEISAASILVRERRFPLGESHLTDLLGLFGASHGVNSLSTGATMTDSVSQVQHNRLHDEKERTTNIDTRKPLPHQGIYDRGDVRRSWSPRPGNISDEE